MAHITRNQRDVLAVLLARPPEPEFAMYTAEVADASGVANSSVLQILDRFEARGWVESFEEPQARMKARGGGGKPRRFWRLTDLGRNGAPAVMPRTPTRKPGAAAADDAAPVVVGDVLAEQLGRLVREVWVSCAEQVGNPKSSWLQPWDELDAFQKLVDTRIGVELYRRGLAAANRQLATLTRERDQARDGARADRRAYSEAQTTIRNLRKEVDRLKAVAELVAELPGQRDD